MPRKAKSVTITLKELIAAHAGGADYSHMWLTAMIDGAHGDEPRSIDPKPWRIGLAIGRRAFLEANK